MNVIIVVLFYPPFQASILTRLLEIKGLGSVNQNDFLLQLATYVLPTWALFWQYKKVNILLTYLFVQFIFFGI